MNQQKLQPTHGQISPIFLSSISASSAPRAQYMAAPMSHSSSSPGAGHISWGSDLEGRVQKPSMMSIVSENTDSALSLTSGSQPSVDLITQTLVWITWLQIQTNEPRREKTGLRGFRPGPTQTGLYKLRKELEA